LAASGKESYAFISKIFYLLTAVCIWLSMILLLYYFISGDFRYAYVYENSSSGLPLPYRIAALWAGKEGSFLVWLFFLNFCGILISRSIAWNARIVSAIIILTQIFLLAILIVESPYLLIWDKYQGSISPGSYPGDGLGLNPLLRDPWMVAHPPVLFLGYASAVVPFAYAMAGLFHRDKDWIRDAFPWLLFSMTALGAGIFLGGYWAYSVLGWGGYWGWDAVENSSLVPWIIAIALVHGFVVQKRTGMLVRTNLFLASLYFLLVFYSTWLTRSGVLSDFSVHSFAASKVSPLLLAFLSIYFLGPCALFVTRFKHMAGVRAAQVTDWKTFTVYGIFILAVYALIILIGTSLPLISSAFMARPTTVTTEFYNNFSGPFGVLIIVLMILSTTAIAVKKPINPQNALLVIVSIALGVLINTGFTRNPVAHIFAILSFLLLARSIYDMVKMKSISLIPSRLSHIGVGLLMLGVITSNFHTTAVQKKLVKNIEYDLGMLRVTFLGLRESAESSLMFAIQRNAKKEIIETAYYVDNKTESLYKEPYIVSGFFNDLYIAPESYESGAGAATHLMLSKGEEREISGVRVRFIEFRTEHMTSGEPTTFTDLTVNGINLSPGIRFSHGGAKHLDRRLPGSDRSVSLMEIDANNKRIVVFISPGKNTIIPPDKVLISISTKRLIWLVWLGTVLIIIGGCYSSATAFKKKKKS
jgi:cytochrome c-type biogenesis protein CcmF